MDALGPRFDDRTTRFYASRRKVRRDGLWLQIFSKYPAQRDRRRDLQVEATEMRCVMLKDLNPPRRN